VKNPDRDKRIDKTLTSILSGTYSEARQSLTDIYQFAPNRRIVCSVCAIKGIEPENLRHLVLVIRDLITNRWIGLRLPTVRKIVKFVIGNKLLSSRALSDVERLKLYWIKTFKES